MFFLCGDISYLSVHPRDATCTGKRTVVSTVHLLLVSSIFKANDGSQVLIF